MEQLIRDRHLQQVVPDDATVTALLQTASRHIATAGSAVDDDPEGAYSLAYDAARKAATALMARQGLRPTSAGGHIAVVDVIRVQFPRVPGLTSLKPSPSRVTASPAHGDCSSWINSGSSDRRQAGGRADSST
ncbi:MAG: hypothetical protein WAL50_14410 [Kineosporiaceae bacterium]